MILYDRIRVIHRLLERGPSVHVLVCEKWSTCFSFIWGGEVPRSSLEIIMKSNCWLKMVL